MTASMLSKVVTAHEASVTNRTDKLFLAGVCTPVTGEFIRSCKFFVAALPVTAEWLFTCVSSKVCLEVRALEISLPAAREAADIVAPTGEL